MTAAIPPVDPGLQPERTLLAWQRTCLAVALGNAVAMRYLVTSIGPLAIAIGVVGLAFAAAAGLTAHRRYRRARGSFDTATFHGMGGVPMAAATAGTAILGVATLLLVIAIWSPWR